MATNDDFFHYGAAAQVVSSKRAAFSRLDAGQAMRVALLLVLAAGFVKLTHTARGYSVPGASHVQDTNLLQAHHNR
jgi:hypothetical protein